MKFRANLALTSTFAALAVAFIGCSNPPAPSNGAAGKTGGAGTTGAAGTTGQAGTTGEAGTGAAGTTGQAGTTGMAGTTGQAGTGGATGVAGAGGTAAGGTAGTGTAGSTGTGGASACPAGVKGHCNGDTGAKDKYPGFTLALAEEFDQPIDLDKDPIWTWSDGGPPEGQTRFAKSQITFAGGQMIITAIKQAVPSSISYAEPTQGGTSGMPGARKVLSGEFRTRYNNYRYGHYEVKFQAPIENGGTGPNGNYLSTMFTFRTPKWAKWRELDLELEADIKPKVAWNLVNADNSNNYPGGDASNAAPVAGFSAQDMHTYIIEWTPGKVTWSVDGKIIHMNTTANVPTISAKIMMNLWVFGGDALTTFGDVSKNVYPFHSTYEYFRFYKANTGEDTYPMDDVTKLPAADTASSRNNSAEVNYPLPTP